MGWTHFQQQFSRGGQIGVFGSAPDPPGPKKGPKGPVCGDPREKRDRRARGLGAPGSPVTSLLLGRMQKVIFLFWPPRARKTGKTARFGPSAGKIESTAATPVGVFRRRLLHRNEGKDGNSELTPIVKALTNCAMLDVLAGTHCLFDTAINKCSSLSLPAWIRHVLLKKTNI